MIYCVVPPELRDELFESLTGHYADRENVSVIVDRRRSDRRGRGRASAADERRVIRDRRRARVPGELPALASSR